MNRRQAIYRTLMLGAALATPSWAMNLLATNHYAATAPFFLSSSENELMTALVDTILPKTATPSASEARVPEFIQMMLKDCYKQTEQDLFKKGLSEIDPGFVAMDKEGRNKVLAKMEGDSIAALKANPRSVTFWKLLKELTLLGYFTSEIGMTQAMEYAPVPGKLELIKLDKQQKTYSEYLAR
ncbi:gluconate 2-dehydrogenase subunit 3 family protein [Flavobacterium sp. XS2P12]|uniref:gluconate 2-dehydrogenase subunit 3 family protein n=1 Tax=Flavobacterium melibiosi TaxID=3398734 RepID=UPI003A8AD234